MALSHYKINSCCKQEVEEGLFLIPGFGIVSDGVYIYNGPTFFEPITGMLFGSGYCYTVTYLGETGATLPPAFNSADITITASNSCESLECADCNLAAPPAYVVYNCCDAANTIFINLDLSGCMDPVSGTWIYTAVTIFTTFSGFEFVPGNCYSFTAVLNGVYEIGPPCTDFNIKDVGCAKLASNNQCPSCDLALHFLVFQSCCGKETLYFKGGTEFDAYLGLIEYLGIPVDGLKNVCYTVTAFPVGQEPITSMVQYNALPEPPIYVEGTSFSFVSATPTCKGSEASCPTCIPQCYTLYNCEGESFNTIIDLSFAVGSWIVIYNAPFGLSSPWLVLLNNGDCNHAVDTITFAGYAQSCRSTCYNATGFGNITYVNDDLELVTELAPLRFCSYIYPTTDPDVSIESFGPCSFDDLNGIFYCEDLCFLLTNCATDEVLVSNTQTLLNFQYQIVTIVGFDGCWEVTINEGDCKCPIPVTVLTHYERCEDCLPIVAYKFTNCDNQTLVQYSTEDWSLYVGKTVLLECGGCWFVTLIDYTPPSLQTITIVNTFNTCIACNRTYYELAPCNKVELPIYSFSDLSAYVGHTVKIDGCPTCFTIELAPEDAYLDEAVPVTVTEDFGMLDGCTACEESKPCLCSIAWPDENGDLSYIDCNGNGVANRGLDPNVPTEKLCIREWVIAREPIYFGECTISNPFADQPTYDCPPPVYPKRFIAPGYTTPSCDTAQYEKISCNAAEALYKTVLTARYGISNCCEEENEKWIIKKELIDLQAAMEPRVICTPVSSCCNNTPTCGCGCNVPTQTTCNSR